jgi:hypothetical protein
MKFKTFLFSILMLIVFVIPNEGQSQDTAKSLSADISWSFPIGSSNKQEIADLSNTTVTAGKTYKLTFYGVFSNDISSSAGFVGEFVLADGADGEFAGISVGQESPTGQLRETWTVNSDNSYQQIQTDGT